MKKITLHIDKNASIIGVGNVQSDRAVTSFDVAFNELPSDFWEAISTYACIDGAFVKSEKIDTHQEKAWQQSELTKIGIAIAEYHTDMAIDELYSELRVSQYNEDDYFKMLGDRKLLIEYVQQDDFPECGRPALSRL
jgi:hypothetical protein